MNLIPYSRYVRTVPYSEKTPFLREFLDAPDTRPLTITLQLNSTVCTIASFVVPFTIGGDVCPNRVCLKHVISWPRLPQNCVA